MPTPSAITLWQRYRVAHPEVPTDLPPVEHFCDKEEDANSGAFLVVAGRKRATASALIEYESAGEPVPDSGKLVIITDGLGNAMALIETKRVTICRFGDVPASFAALEGEGDGSLAWWRDKHRSFWKRSLARGGKVVDDDLKVVCEEFDVVLIA